MEHTFKKVSGTHTGSPHEETEVPQILETRSIASVQAWGGNLQKDTGKYSQLFLNTVETQDTYSIWETDGSHALCRSVPKTFEDCTVR